jgi:hypothetical protein
MTGIKMQSSVCLGTSDGNDQFEMVSQVRSAHDDSIVVRCHQYTELAVSWVVGGTNIPDGKWKASTK